jgi:rifampicin phosphotransferase
MTTDSSRLQGPTSENLRFDGPFVPPGPGQWNLDRSHYPGGVTAISQWLLESGMESGLGRAMRELGAPIGSISARFVNGFMYTRTVPLVGAHRSATKLPPLFVLKAATRLHPEFRRRTRVAAEVLLNPKGPAVVARWTDELRPSITAVNDRFDSVELSELDDAQLGRHCEALLAHLHSMSDLHFWLHGYDLGPIARFVAFTKSCTIPTTEAVQLLAGASPSTAVPRRKLTAIRAAVGSAKPTTLAELRAVSSEVDQLVGGYLKAYGSTLVTGYDITSLTLGELPETLFDSIMNAHAVEPESTEDIARQTAAVRSRIPENQRSTFDARLAEAREVMDMRDDNGPTVFERPTGILRLGLLELGRRLFAAGRAHRPEHAFELRHDEVGSALTAAPHQTATADELAARAAARLAASRLAPPQVLGPIEAAPPARVLPGPLAEFAETVQIALAELGMDGAVHHRDPLTGTGIGTTVYRGRARRAESAEQAIDEMEPGDVLIVRATSPAFNVVLSIAGAVVTADGGPLSHAAVLARELGIPAIVGATGALDIDDGVEVEVDPLAGIVRVLG